MKFLQQIDQLSSAPDILFLSFLGLGSGQMVSLINCYHQWNEAGTPSRLNVPFGERWRQHLSNFGAYEKHSMNL